MHSGYGPAMFAYFSSHSFRQSTAPRLTLLPNKVIIQVWISTHFGVLSKRPRSADEGFGFIKAVLRLPAPPVKDNFDKFF